METYTHNRIISHYLPKWAEAFYRGSDRNERIWFLGCMVNAILSSINESQKYDTECIVLRIRGAIAEAAAKNGDFDPACTTRANLEFWAVQGEFAPLGEVLFKDSQHRATDMELALGIPPMESSKERLEVLDALKGEFTMHKKLTEQWVERDESRCRQID